GTGFRGELQRREPVEAGEGVVGKDYVEALREGGPEAGLRVDPGHVADDAVALQGRVDQLGITDVVLEMEDTKRRGHARLCLRPPADAPRRGLVDDGPED